MNIRKICIIVFITSVMVITKVNASSVDYNLIIDNNKHFYETITYTIDDQSENPYLKSIIYGDVYFDYNKTVKYEKENRKSQDKTIVILKHDYDEQQMKNSRIVKECFDKAHIKIDNYRISFYADLPLKCYDRADEFNVNITTDVNVMNTNADLITGKSYIWTNIKSIPVFHIELGEIDPSSGVLPPISCLECTNNYVPIDHEYIPNSSNKYINFGIMGTGMIACFGITLLVIKRAKTQNQA